MKTTASPKPVGRLTNIMKHIIITYERRKKFERKIQLCGIFLKPWYHFFMMVYGDMPTIIYRCYVVAMIIEAE